MYLNKILSNAAQRPDAIAIIDSGRPVSYALFARTIERTRRYLNGLSLPESGVFVDLTRDLGLSWVLLLALRSLGRTTLSAAAWQTAERLQLKDVAAVFTLDGDAALAAVPDHHPVHAIPRSVFAGVEDDPLPEPSVEGRFGDHILFTSGTTGVHKMIVARGDAAEDMSDNVFTGIFPTWLSPDGVHHNGSFGPWTRAGYRTPLAFWHHGGTVVFEQRPAELVFDRKVTSATMLAPGIRQLCDMHAARPGIMVPPRILTGGGFIDADVALRAVRQLGCRLYVAYAGTEFRVCLEQEVGSEEDVVWLTPTSVPGCEIVDEQDEPVADGDEGILRVRRSPIDPHEYLNDSVATAAHFRGDYFYPGDLAVRRADGRVRILGRTADVLIVAGQKLAIGPFEERTRAILGVGQLCLFNSQQAGGIDELLVVIEGTDMPDAQRCEMLRSQVAAHFPSLRFALIERFPRGDNGMMKVNRREVRRLAG